MTLNYDNLDCSLGSSGFDDADNTVVLGVVGSYSFNFIDIVDGPGTEGWNGRVEFVESDGSSDIEIVTLSRGVKTFYATVQLPGCLSSP